LLNKKNLLLREGLVPGD